MSELRQRNVGQDERDTEIQRLRAELAEAKGEALTATSGTEGCMATSPAIPDEAPLISREVLVREIQQRLLASAKGDVKPGLGHEAHRAKLALDREPLNMTRILACGRAYAREERWGRAANVLLRGYGRASEFEEPEDRFEFWLLLAQGSIKSKQYKQALAALSHMEEPDDEESVLAYLVCATQTYGFNGDVARTLKSCNRLVDQAEKSDDWMPVLGAYCSCVPALRTCGAHDAAKSTLMSKLKPDEMRSKLEALEKLAEIQEELREAAQARGSAGRRNMMIFATLMLLLVFLAILYMLERHSLARIGAK